ncbi:hypothetical protein MASR1M107_08670 [Ignavibacteriales bacterium]
MHLIARINLVLVVVFSSLSIFPQVIPVDSLYLGQTPPGSTPKIFSLQLTSGFKACERIAISSDGKEIYYGEINNYPPSALRVKCYKYDNNRWTGPFNVFEGFMAPRFANNDSILFLQNNHFFTYIAKREGTGWSVPVRLLSNDIHTHYFQKSGLNNSYASSYYEGSPTDGNISKIITGLGDTVLQSLGAPVNSTSQESDFWISMDESYLLFSRNPGNGAGDIFISFKKENGRWTNPKKIGEPISKPGSNWEYGQFVSNDGKYLFYTSGGTSWSSYYTYWVRIDSLIDSLRRTNYAPYLNRQIPDQSGVIGQVCSYTIPDSTFIDDDGNNTIIYSATLTNGNPLPEWLSFDHSNNTFIGTPSGGMNSLIKVIATDTGGLAASCSFTMNVSVTGVENEVGQIPSRMELYQNYPNPFNPSTSIKIAIPEGGRYKLDLFNALGEKVKVISERDYEAGYHIETLDATGLSSGIYIYKLTGPGMSVGRKLIILQ